MPRDYYQTKSPILGIYTDPTRHKIPVTIPQRAIVEAVEMNINGNHLVDVLWEDKLIMMFTVDLRNRCDKVSAAASTNI